MLPFLTVYAALEHVCNISAYQEATQSGRREETIGFEQVPLWLKTKGTGVIDWASTAPSY